MEKKAKKLQQDMEKIAEQVELTRKMKNWIKIWEKMSPIQKMFFHICENIFLNKPEVVYHRNFTFHFQNNNLKFEFFLISFKKKQT